MQVTAGWWNHDPFPLLSMWLVIAMIHKIVIVRKDLFDCYHSWLHEQVWWSKMHCLWTFTSFATAFLCHRSCLSKGAQPSMYTGPYWGTCPGWTALLVDGQPYLFCKAKPLMVQRSVTDSARNIAMRLKPFQNDLIGGFAVSLVRLFIRHTRSSVCRWLCLWGLLGHGYKWEKNDATGHQACQVVGMSLSPRAPFTGHDVAYPNS